MIALADLRGHWRLEREIEDLSAGLTGQLAGAAIWRADDAGLIQEETGLLEFGGARPVQADRRYLWRVEGDGLAVLFEDGRPFHRIGPGRLSDRHDCPPDTYDVTYVFGETGVFSTTWRVIGPRKDLIIRSHYTPMS
jgi:hypothetical protein